MAKSKLTFVKPTEEELNHDREIFNKIKFGHTQPSPEDPRDFVASAVVKAQKFPKEYLAPQTEILDQGLIGSCVAHACATALAQGEEVMTSAHNDYSRGYIYGNRKPTDAQGEGMIVRQALKQLHNCGDVFYVDFPYNKSYGAVKKLIEARKEELAQKALPNAILDFYRCYSIDQIKSTIMTRGGVVICIPVYSNFGRDLHKPQSGSVEGYHAMIIIGWTENNQWVVQNSWGDGWGYSGKLLMDMDYPVSEFWGVTVNKGDNPPAKVSIWKKILGFFMEIINFWKRLFSKKS